MANISKIKLPSGNTYNIVDTTSGYLTTESDPIFSASAAAGITSTDITNWNGKVSDTGKWNGVALGGGRTDNTDDLWIPCKTENGNSSGTAYWINTTQEVPNNNYTVNIPRYKKINGVPYLQSTTPSANDNSTKVATTAYVDAAIPDISGKADKSATVSTITYDSTNKKLTKTINGTTSDVVTVATLKTALGSMPASDVYSWAKASSKPSYSYSEITGTVPSSALPSYVDDVLEYTAKANFPTTGETGKIYVDTATNLTYRWGGSNYVEISPSLALGTTSSTAFRGDYGNTAYTHATDANRLTTAKTSGLYKIAVTTHGHVQSVTAVAKADITGLGIPAQDTTYSSKAAASGGTDVSLVTTGEKYTWNNKIGASNPAIATDTGTSSITLAHGGKYKLTAGGGSIVFTMPSDANTWRGIQDNLTSSTNTTESLSAKQGYLLANGSARDSTKLPLTGGNVTGPVNFGDSISVDDATVGNLIVNGSASFTNGIKSSAYNGGNPIYFIKGTQTAATNVWTGTLPDEVTSYYDGLTIDYFLPYAGTGTAATLNLSGLGAKPVYVGNTATSGVTTHYGANTVIHLTYVVASNLNSGNGCWKASNYYDTNTVSQLRWDYTTITAGTAGIFPYTLIMMNTSGNYESIVTSSSTGTSKARNTVGFVPGTLLTYYASGTTTSGNKISASNYGVFEAYNALDFRYSANISTSGLTVGKPVLLVGTVTNGLFYLDATWWTQTLPTSDDGKVYMYVGMTYNIASASTEYRVDLAPYHPMYWYKNGALRQYGNDAATINGLTVQTAVPSGAKFTDTVTTATTTGSGNAVTAVSASNGALTITKGTTFLTSHNTYTVSTTGSGNAVTAVSLSGTTLTVTKGTTFPTTDTNTWRTIQVNGSDILTGETNTGKLNLKAGTNVSISNSTSGVIISATSNIGTITSVKTTAGAHTAINVTSGAVSFNVPTTAAHVGAVPDCTIGLYNGNAGNPNPIRFLDVNYTNANSENGVLIKVTMRCGHGNGTSYNFLQDVFISVGYTGTVSVDIYRYYAQSITYESVTHYYGDIFYTIDTTNKIVTFYTLMGQYSTVYSSSFRRMNNSSGGTIAQYTSATKYSSGTKTYGTVHWLNGGTIRYGTSTPASSLGSNGDIYVKYS